MCFKSFFLPLFPAPGRSTAYFHNQAYGEITEPCSATTKGHQTYLGWRCEVPTSWWPRAESKLTDVLEQRWRAGRGQRQKETERLPAVLVLEKWSQLENF